MIDLTIAIICAAVAAPLLVRMAIKDKAATQILLLFALAVISVWFVSQAYETPDSYRQHEIPPSYIAQRGGR